MNYIKLVILSFFLSAFSWADVPLKRGWKDLADVTFERKFFPEEQNYFYVPTFGKSVLSLNNKRVQITGYYIPFAQDFAVLSAFPMASCFFCGAAGPETMVEIQFAQKTKRYKTDDRLTIEGTFKTNATDVDHLNYILENAKVVE